MENTRVDSDVQLLIENLGHFPEPVVEPALIVVSGLPGTGKTFLCNKLAEKLPIIVLESDALRKTLFPSPTYSQPESSRLFQAIHHLVAGRLKRGIPLILDATNLSELYRERLYNIADRQNARLILVRVEAPSDLVQERLKNRSEKKGFGEKSDADWTVYQKLRPTAQKISRKHYAVDTSRDITPVLNKIVREVNR